MDRYVKGMLNGFDLAYREELTDHAFPISNFFGIKCPDPDYYRGFRAGYNAVLRARLSTKSRNAPFICSCCEYESDESNWLTGYCEECAALRCDCFFEACPKAKDLL